MTSDAQGEIVRLLQKAQAERRAVEERYRADLERHRQSLAPLIRAARENRLTNRQWADAYGITERHAQRLADDLGLPKLGPGGKRLPAT
ncbi:hypothetical protein [Nonomuraea typhae]|uniref:hypothetical protein n=1 Tax=Nonomuraea typhae TaxID=2603600 RepID=UPI0012FAF5CE|nr:hypothetical protein [Nonomuraea typhae]